MTSDKGSTREGPATRDPCTGEGRATPGPGTREGGTTRADGLDVARLQRRLADFAAARNWEPYHTPKNLAVALSVEAAELVEIFQWLTPEQSAAVMADEKTAHRVRDEAADVLAYLLQFCEVLGVDVLAALRDKIERNEARFPVGSPGETPGEQPDREH